MNHKNCPFCNSEVDADCIEPDESQGFKWGAVVCPGCGAKGPEVRTGHDRIEHWSDDALDAWDARARHD
ncbi:hypothetical protein [Halomonas sp. NO4]|uniref:hypothetical protein n=1 Tax=Halomonas sp. NO4 TaxID=2484813 RepID=UPI0013CF8ECD|nr:hypothetical protein [Halomonas sp. NO4]